MSNTIQVPETETVATTHDGPKRKQMLILNLISKECKVEIDQIVAAADMLNVDCVRSEPITKEQDLIDELAKGMVYDYVYVAGHGSSDGLCGDKDFCMSWVDFSEHVCDVQALNSGCVFLLACCGGGMMRVAVDVFIGCPNIEYVFGPRWLVHAQDITAAFHVFMYNMEFRQCQPDQAAARASDATGYDFHCFDRFETEQTQHYYDRFIHQNGKPPGEVD